METYVLRWTKDNLPFWQGVDNGEKIEINSVADVINEHAKLKRKVKELESMAKCINEGRLTEAEMHAHLYFGGTFKRKGEGK